MQPAWFPIVAGVVVALALFVLAGFVVANLSPRFPARGIAVVLAATAGLLGLLYKILPMFLRGA